MQDDINTVVLSGRLVRDPDLKVITTGTHRADFTLAVNHYNVKKREPQAAFIDCVAYGRIADFVQRWFSRGDEMIIERGTISVLSYEGARGFTSKLIINAIVVKFGQKNKANVQSANGKEMKELFTPPPPTDADEYIPAGTAEGDNLPF